MKLKSMQIIYLILCFTNTLWANSDQVDNIEVKAGIPIYIRSQAPEAVKLAAQDLQKDLENVLGAKSEIINQLPHNRSAIVISTADDYQGKIKPVSKWEEHQIYTDGNTIVLNGADMRGTIYAIYSFSEKVLGVNPLWRWTSENPEHKDKVFLKSDFHEKFDSPSIKYRAWFPNDRDLIIPWQYRNEENYGAFIETMLRLKLNVLEGGIADRNSFKPPFPVGKEAGLASRRGLMNTGHHMLIFGSSYNNWNDYWKNVRDTIPPKFNLDDRKSLKEFWGYHIDLAQKNNLDVIWLVGFRGNRDIPFWEFFPDAPADDPSRAKIIEEMVDIQISLLKEKTGKKNPLMRLTLYNEMSRLVANGDFHIPKEDSLIHNFVAARRDHFPNRDLTTYNFNDELVGYYMNLQFTSSGSHLAQAEGPWKMEQNFRMVNSVSDNNLIFSVMNAGNIREHLVGLSANAAMMWDFKGYDTDAFMKKYAEHYFGKKHSSKVAKLYKDFFDSYWQQKNGDIEGFERQYIFQDMRYARAAEMLLTDLENGIYRPNVLHGHKLDNPDKGSVGYFRVEPEDNGVENQVEAMIKGTAASILKLEKITSTADSISSELKKNKTFFDDNLKGQAYLMLHLNKMLNMLAKAYKAEKESPEQKDLVGKSLEESNAAWKQLEIANHAPFNDWYENDRLFGMRNIQQRLQKIYNQNNKL